MLTKVLTPYLLPPPKSALITHTMRTLTLVTLLHAAVSHCAEMEQKEGQTLAPSFTCGKYTSRTVLIGSGTTSVVKSNKGTMRCTVLYKVS